MWWNSTRMHIFTHLKPASEGKTGLGIYADGMVEHDARSASCSPSSKELGIEDNTIVMYSTDNGAETFTWPDGGTTMFRGEKNTNWEGGYRVPTIIRWPGVIKPGTVVNDIAAHEDMLTTLLAAAGEPERQGGAAQGQEGRRPDLQGPSRRLRPRAGAQGRGAWPRQRVHLLDRRRQRRGLRYDNWKVTFLKQKAEGLGVWQEPFEELRAPSLANLRMDPFERAEEENAMGYQRWYIEHMFLIAPGGGLCRAAGCRASASSRRARSRAASTSTASWRR